MSGEDEAGSPSRGPLMVTDRAPRSSRSRIASCPRAGTTALRRYSREATQDHRAGFQEPRCRGPTPPARDGDQYKLRISFSRKRISPARGQEVRSDGRQIRIGTRLARRQTCLPESASTTRLFPEPLHLRLLLAWLLKRPKGGKRSSSPALARQEETRGTASNEVPTSTTRYFL